MENQESHAHNFSGYICIIYQNNLYEGPYNVLLGNSDILYEPITSNLEVSKIH